MNSISPYAKAFVGSAVAGLTALGTALADNGVTAQEWVGVALAVFATFGLVRQVPNSNPGT